MKPAPAIDVELSPQALDALKAAARASRQRERGGILIGYRTERGVRVEDALTVPDATAVFSRYLRRNKTAQAVLDDYLSTVPDPTIGYVGEWHTHPLPSPPSPTDQAAMRIMAIKNPRPVALIVAALATNTRDVSVYAMVSTPDGIARRLVGSAHAVPIRIDE